LDIFATVHEKTARRSASIGLHALWQDQFESVQAKSSRLATPAELKNPSNAKELHGQTESIAPIASKRISGVLANREFGRSTTVKSGRRSML
jgi:hypothetical protein